MARTFVRNSSAKVSTTTPVTGYPFTLSMWGRCTNVTNDQAAFGIYDTDGGQYYVLWFRGATGDVVSASTGLTTFADSSASYTNGQWHHVAGVFSSATSRTVYLDGGNSGTNTTSNTQAACERVVFATTNGFGASNGFDGSIANAGIYNVALTAGQIISLASGAPCPAVRPDALVAWYPFKSESPDVDWWGQHNLTTGTGTPTYSQHPPIIYPSGTRVFIPAGSGGIPNKTITKLQAVCTAAFW